MGWILRTSNDLQNPTLPGGVYGKYITAGRAVYWNFDGTRTRGIIFISDGGRYGLDHVDSFEYKGDQTMVENTDWIFHPGTLTAQIIPKTVSDIDTGTDVLTSAGHGYSNGNLVRIGTINGNMPTPALETARYQISDVTTDTFKLKDEFGGSYINFSDEGTGTVIVWRANAGFDDPIQGLPSFCPEVNTTFNNIAYVEFKLPANRSSLTEQPDWGDFRIIGTGRKLMDYDDEGAELGVVSGDDDALSNVALEIADNMIVNYDIDPARIDWPSWDALKTDSDVLIWQRIPADEIEDSGHGFRGQYFADMTFTDLVLTRNDPLIDFTSQSGSPGSGVPAEHWSAIWTCRIQAEFSEIYTIRALHNNDVKVYIDGNLIIDKVLADGTDHTAPYTFVADQFYDLEVRFVQDVSTWQMELKWSSVSQTEEYIPTDRAFLPATPVRRYECHAAFPHGVEASEVHERLMERVPGWDWTDDAGLIKFLPPNRPISFTFAFDRIDNDSQANFVKGTLTKKRRPIAERPNFLLFRFRDREQEGFPFRFVQADREELRDLTSGEPTNRPADDIGVSTRSLAERIAEMVMVLQTDPKFTASISGSRSSSKVRKCHFVMLSYYDVDGNYVVDEKCLVTFHAWGAQDSKNDFTLLPIPTPYYSDEVFVEE